MWEIVVDDRGARLVQGARWALIVGILMIVFGVLGAVLSFVNSLPIVGFIFLGLMVVPGAALTQTLGKHRERRIAAVVKTVAVPGGVNVTLRDETNKNHELPSDADTVRRILDSLTSGN